MFIIKGVQPKQKFKVRINQVFNLSAVITFSTTPDRSKLVTILHLFDFEMHYIRSATESLRLSHFTELYREITGLKFFSVLVKTEYCNSYNLKC